MNSTTLRKMAFAVAAALAVSATSFAQTNVSQGKSTSASSVQGTSVAGNAADGNTGTRWTAADGTFPQWWRVDLGSAHTLTRADINWFSNATRAYKYRVEVSSDDANYTTVVDKTGNTAFGPTSDAFSAMARYVRVTVTGSSAGFASAYEIEIFGSVGGGSPPVINSALTAGGTVNAAFSYTITATNTPTSFGATGLPSGLSVNTSTGVISGTPTATGTSNITISATNASGTDTKTLVLTVNPASGGGNLALGKSVSASSSEGANPAANANDDNATGTRWTAANGTFPQWWRVDLGSSQSVGRVDVAWYASATRSYKYLVETSTDDVNYTTRVDKSGNTAFGNTSDAFAGVSARYVRVTVTGSSAGWASAFEIAVFAPGGGGSAPVINSALTAGGTVSTAFSYTITATNSPTSFGASGLPSGLSVNTSTGVISGTPTATGTSNITISATNASGTDTKTLVLTVAAASGGTNVALGKTYSASTFRGGNVEGRAFDGAMNTRWESQHLENQWIQVDLGALHSITGVKLFWEGAYGKNYTIQVSDNGTTWDEPVSVVNGDGGLDEHAFSTNARYVRMDGTLRGTGWGYSLHEFEVYGSVTPTAPGVPAGLAATPASGSQITVTWNPVSGATGYDLQRDGTTIASVTSPYAHTGLGAGTTHTYAVRAKNSVGNSAFSATVSATTPTIPAVPTGLAAVPNSSSQITVSWNPVSGATGYDLQRDGVTLTSVNSPYAHTGLGAGTTHTYAVRAKNAAGNSAYSGAVSATTQAGGSGPVPLFGSGTTLEPAMVEDTSTAIITRWGDRARDRHARESEFHIYDHYLTFYWEDRTAKIVITDKVAKGGTEVVFDIYPLWPLQAPEFRAFFRGINTKAEYFTNLSATRLAPLHYRATLTFNPKEGRAIQIGDRMEVEVSQFLEPPPNGRANYYGTTVLYMVGTGGIVPWYGLGPVLASGAQDSYPLPEHAWMGGRATLPYQYSNEPQHRFKQLAGHMSETNVQPFMLGRRLLHTDFVNGVHDEPGNPVFTEHIGKTGPRYVARSCVACHVGNGRALPLAFGALLTNGVTRVGNDTNGTPHTDLGVYLQSLSTSGAPEATVTVSSWTTTNGTYGDGTPFQLRKPVYAFTGANPQYHSFRIAPQLVGLGLLEAVEESTIASFADPNDANADGISGRMQLVTDPETGHLRLGRFGAKAGQARISHQIASALNNDMGVTTAIFPNIDRGSTQPNPGPSTELSSTDLDLLYRYIATLGVAARRDLADPQALLGETLFASANCVKCHIPSMPTSPHHPLAEVRGQTIRPYSDLLLHDMGPGLADNMGEGAASGAEWRTAPLWSIGLTAGVSGGEAYLHDGRARSIAEAILWHGGEAEASKEAFRTMSASDRAALIKFIQSL